MTQRIDFLERNRDSIDEYIAAADQALNRRNQQQDTAALAASP